MASSNENAGIPKQVEPVQYPAQQQNQQQPDYFATQQPQYAKIASSYSKKKPNSQGGKKIIIVLIVFIALALIIWGIFSAYQALGKKEAILGRCIALATNNPSYCAPSSSSNCSNISEVDCTTKTECCNRNECEEGVLFSRALKTSDAGVCEQIKQEFTADKLTCKAVVNKDPSLCAGISDNIDRIACEATVANDYSKCSALKGIEEPNSPGNSAELTCLESVYGNLAQLNRDISYCKKIKGLTNFKVHKQSNFADTYYTYLECMADIKSKVEYCNLGYRCAGSQEEIINCLYQQVSKSIEKEVAKGIEQERRETERALREQARKTKGDWEYYKKTHNLWWMFW